MEFNIRKGASLPFIEVNFSKDGNKDYNYTNTNLSESVIYFYMKNVDTDVYKIAKSVSTYDNENNKIYYQFTKKNTSIVGRYEGEFKIYNEQGLIDLPLHEKIFINILPSISDSKFCCGKQYINPTPIPPQPAPTGIYYGKFSETTITSGDVSSLIFEITDNPTDNYFTLPETITPKYGYIIIPSDLPQPSDFRDSDEGCDNFNIPTNLIDTIIIKDGNGFLIQYNVYRTFWPFVGEVNCWLCV